MAEPTTESTPMLVGPRNLIDPDSVIGFDEFIRDDAMAVGASPGVATQLVTVAIGFSVVAGCLGAIIFAVIGLVSVLIR